MKLEDIVVQTLINESPDLDDEEKKYWIELIPNMNKDQIEKLKIILEKDQSPTL